MLTYNAKAGLLGDLMLRRSRASTRHLSAGSSLASDGILVNKRFTGPPLIVSPNTHIQLYGGYFYVVTALHPEVDIGKEKDTR